MRTTLVIDDDLLQAAKALAESRSTSVGKVICELARKGLATPRPRRRRNGLPLFRVPQGAQPITLRDVKKLEDEP